MLSALLQIPWLAAALGPERAIGVLTAHGGRLTPELLALAGAGPEHRVHVAGMEHRPVFRGPILDETALLDTDAIQAEIVAEAEALVARHSDIGAVVLECSNMPPYAHAIQAATGLPVFDFITMIDYFHAGQSRRAFQGRY
jgi:Asp/Glu/hydantoin racemase